MSALVVVETYFGNTRHIADVVANGLRSDGIDTEVVTVEDAPTQLDDGIELLVIGAPTHDLGLSTAESRQAACARQGHIEPMIGVREWMGLVTVPSIPPLVAIFDTRTGYPWLAGFGSCASFGLPVQQRLSCHSRPRDVPRSGRHRTSQRGRRRAR